MKVLLSLFLFCISNFVYCYDEIYTGRAFDNTGKPYRNKILRRDLLILNPKVRPPLISKHPYYKKGYTVFSSIDKKRPGIYIAPDSPYFQIDHDTQPKARVKKVLPSYWSSRIKRSIMATTKSSNVGLIKADTSKKEGNVDQSMKRDKTKVKKDTKIGKKEKNIKRTHDKNVNGDAKKVSDIAKKRIARSHHSHSRKHHKRSKSERSKKRSMLRHGGHKKNSKRSSSKHHHSRKAAASRRLIAAKDAKVEDYPYVVSIQKDHEHWCSGAILNPRLVITTANCIWKSHRASRLMIRVGSRNPHNGGQTAKVAEVMKHPSWSIRKLPDNDVGLLLLDKNLKFSDSVHAVDLPNLVMKPAFADAWVTSFGAERRDGVYEDVSQTLQAYHAHLINRTKCNNITTRFGVVVTENFICLAQTGKRAPCTRDTGAPAVSDGVLWGLASWGIRKLCGTERFPAMFSYLGSASNINFIANATRYLMSEKRTNPLLDAYPRAEDK